MPPLTGTICPFPLAWPEGSPPPPSNISDADYAATVAAWCTITFSEWLGARHQALQIVLCLVSLSCLLAMLVRLVQLRRYAHAQRQRLRDQPSFLFMSFGTLFLFLLSVENLDVFAFRGWYPAEFYYILDELVAGTLIVCGMVVVNFWLRIARGFGNGTQGLPAYEMYFTIFCLMGNFWSWIIVGTLIDPSRFLLYESIKSFGGAGIMIGFLVRATLAVRELRRTLTHGVGGGGTGSTGPNNNNNHSAPPIAGSDAAPPPAAKSSISRRAVSVLEKKFAHFALILVLAAVALLINGFLALKLDEGMDWQWRVRVEDQYDAIQIVLRVVYLLGALAVISFFRVPRLVITAGGVGARKSMNHGSATRDNGLIPAAFVGLLPGLLSSSSSLNNLVGGGTSPVMSANNKKRSMQVNSQISLPGVVDTAGGGGGRDEQEQKEVNF